MSAQRFKFASPGVEIAEVDNSQLPASPVGVGPLLIGRTTMGPANRPVLVNSFSNFVETFGNPVAGGAGGDIWRDGNYTAPTYMPYAAQAWFANSSPAMIIRLLGTQHTNATTVGKAGWQTDATTPTMADSTNGGAYGLFIINSSSTPDCSDVTGALAAVWYVNAGSVTLSGNIRASSTKVSADAVMIESVDSSAKFIAEVRSAAGAVTDKIQFNFVPSSQFYARNVFNTNPTLTNTAITTATNRKTYWLGETYEQHLAKYVSLSTKCFGVILPLASGSVEGADFRFGMQPAETGWFFSQDLSVNSGSYNPDNMTKLFKFVALNSGEWEQQNFKVSIEDITPPTNEFEKYGTFTVAVRMASDSDNAQSVVEKYSRCSLNPFADNYIAKKIGDKYQTWDDTERRFREYGAYDNVSRYIRVQLNTDVDAGVTDSLLLPFGVYGPPRYKGFAVFSGSTSWPGTFGSVAMDTFKNAFIVGSGSCPHGPSNGQFVQTADSALAFTGSFVFPAIALRSGSDIGNVANPTDAHFGADTTKGTSPRFEESYKDMVRTKPSGIDAYTADGTTTEYSWIFTLDDLAPAHVGSTINAQYASGSRVAGTSFTAATSSWSASLDIGFDSFTSPLFGGFDGLDITEREPFRNTLLTGTPNERTSYVFNTIKRAIDSARDPLNLEFSLAAIPGLTHAGLTQHLITVCEDRQTAMAVIDLENDYVPATEATSETMPNYRSVITSLRTRGMNSSYGTAYYPWVQARDTINGATLWLPPSVAAIGVYAYTQLNADLWWAPMGFERGGLTAGRAGIPIVGVREKVTKPMQDALYEANINPIAKFPRDGIVMWGQKTLQVVPSATDRINVRMVMNYIKREIGYIAMRFIAEPNVEDTWTKFKARVRPMLNQIKSRFGIADYRIQLDRTTTTPDLIDRNIAYARIWIVPVRTLEGFALTFNISNTGIVFQD